ncbi:dihydroorotase, multifunctional complex type, partial [sediment metagenome]
MTPEMIILQNGRILDPATGRDETGDIWIEGGKITVSGQEIPERALCVDLAGKWVMPGLIDMHVHLREPGHEYKETI